MISDSQTNFVYLADTLPLKYASFSAELEQLLTKANLRYSFLQRTKDVWTVDYMPIQIKVDEFVQFKYYPDYLVDTIKWKKSISDTDLICAQIGLKTKKSKIILDGGNVVRNENKVIMCDKIFFENPKMGFKALISELENIFSAEIINIPTHPLDKIGHADGILRFHDEKTVLINDFSKEDKSIGIRYKSALKNAGIAFIEIPYNPYKNKINIDAAGIYINYLEVGNTIVLPTFNIKEDVETLKKFEELFPKHRILTLESLELAKNGGVLNCITWNIVKSSHISHRNTQI